MLCGSHVAGSSAGRFRNEHRHFPRSQIDPEGFPDEQETPGFRMIADFRRKPARKQVSSITRFSMTQWLGYCFRLNIGMCQYLFLCLA